MPRPFSKLVEEINRLQRVDRAARRIVEAIGSVTCEKAVLSEENRPEWHFIRSRRLADLYQAVTGLTGHDILMKAVERHQKEAGPAAEPDDRA